MRPRRAGGGRGPVRGAAGLGSVHAALPGSLTPERLTGILDGLRHVLMARTGHAVVVAAPPELAVRAEMATRAEFF